MPDRKPVMVVQITKDLTQQEADAVKRRLSDKLPDFDFVLIGSCSGVTVVEVPADAQA